MPTVLSRRDMLRLGGTGAGALIAGSFASAVDRDPWTRAAAIVGSVRPPVFPNRDVLITRHGAQAGGAHMNSTAIADAIAACARAGGGRVVVPEGVFLTGSVHLRSGVNLHLMPGATLRFSTDPTDYPLVLTRWEGMELMGLSPLVYAHGQQNIAITGEGTLDGQGSPDHWWQWKGPWQGTVDNGWREGQPDQRRARARLFAMAERGEPVAQRRFGAESLLRPVFIQPYACRNVLIEGVHLRGSPFWQLHPVLCRNVLVRNVDAMGHGPNNDGCDPESTQMAVIQGCTFDTGDDCIAIKSGRNADGRRLHVPTQDIVIRDCRMKEGHGGIAIGSEISGGVNHIFGERCRMDSPHLDYALRFKNNAMRGGDLHDFHYRDIEVGQVAKAAIGCDFTYEEAGNGPFRPTLSHIRIERLTAAGAAQVLDSQGLPGAPITDIELSDCRFDNVSRPSVVRYTEGLRLDRVRVNGRAVAALA